MHTQIHEIQPADAHRFLAHHNNTNARPMSHRTPSEYARDMIEGRWQLTHQGLAFTGKSLQEPGELVDGQNRLKAVTIANVPVKFNVTFGAPTHSKIDYGIRRPIHIVTGISKFDLAVSSVVLQAITGTTPTTAEREMFCRRFPGIGNIADKAQHLPGVTKAPIHAAFAISAENGITEATKWYVQMCNLDPAMPPAIRRLLLSLQRDGKSFLNPAAKRSPAYAIALRAIYGAQIGDCPDKFYPTSIIENLEKYDGMVGDYCRSVILKN